MGFFRLARGAAVCLLVATLGVLPAMAQTPSKQGGVVRVGIINLEQIDQKAALFKSIRSQMEKYRLSFQKAVKAEEDALRKADKELARQRTILSSEAYAEQRRKFEKRVVDFQRQAQQRKQNLNMVYNKAMVEAQGRLKTIVEEYAKQHNIDVVMRSDTLVSYLGTLDMTPAILQRLDKAVPTIAVPKPEQ